MTTRDWDFVTDLHTPLSEVMTMDIETAQYGEPAAGVTVSRRQAAQCRQHAQQNRPGWLDGARRLRQAARPQAQVKL